MTLAEDAARRRALPERAWQDHRVPDVEQRVLTPWAVVSALVLGGAVAGGAYVGEVATAALLVVTGLVMTYGWPRLLDLPSPRGVQLVLVLATVAMAGATLLGDGRDLRWVPVALAITLVASFLHQLVRRDGRARLVVTLGGNALGAGLIASGACFVGACEQDDGALLVLATVIAVVLSTALDSALHSGRRAEWALPVAVGLSSAAAAGIAVIVDGPVLATFLVAVSACVVSHAIRRVLTVVATAASQAAQVAVGAAALLSTGALPYVGVWLIEWFATH